jgi:hypothetical protein
MPLAPDPLRGVRWSTKGMDIGLPKRVIEIEPASLPVPEPAPILEPSIDPRPEPEPILVPEPTPAPERVPEKTFRSSTVRR